MLSSKPTNKSNQLRIKTFLATCKNSLRFKCPTRNDLIKLSDTEISTEPGTIYFIRERDLITNEISPFVKIGLTALRRKTTDRKNDLQTGNPRELFVAHEIVVPCVRAVETALRYKFLAQNVNLEWHFFSEKSENQIQHAVNFCEELKEQFAKQVSSIEEAKRLDNTPSTKELIPPTEEAVHWRNQFLVHHEIVKLGRTAATMQRMKAKECFQNGEEIPDGIRITERQISEVNWNQFQKIYPEIVEKYIKRQLSGVFKILGKITQKETTANLKISETETEVKKFFELFNTEKNHGDPSPELRQQRIKLQQLTKISTVEKELARCHLKTICGTAPGITNICSWVRELSRPKLDTAHLLREHEYLLTPFTSNKKLITTTLTRSVGKVAENLKSQSF